MARVTVDFWDPLDADGNHLNLLPIVGPIAELDVARRMRDRGTEYRDFFTISRITQHQAFGLGARIRRENLPEIIDLHTGEFRPHDLPEEEGLAEVVHFLFDRRLRVLLLQRNRIFRVGAFIELAAEVSGVNFDVQPKMRQDAWARFQRMETIGSLEFKLDTPEHHPDFADTIPSMNQFLNEASQEVHAYTIDLKLSVGRVRNQSLARQTVRRIANALRREGNVSKLTARGKEEGERKSEVVNFLRDRLVHSGEVRYDGRHLDRAQCEQLLREALDRHQDYLRTLM